MKKHANIPVFIPHLGCPNQCVFCNQKTISGVTEFDITKVKDEINTALETICRDTSAEIAFFGGSFTGIDRELMTELLKIGYEYIKSGKIESIRCSTRPDYIDEEILSILRMYGVKTIELGLQSSNDMVLAMTKRGHGSEHEIKACKMITDAGFDLVGQMMIGLPGSTLEDEMKTAEFIVSSGASAARIYPTVVFRDTELCQMAISGEYHPITLEEATERSARILQYFCDNNIRVIRIGLCASENLTSDEKYYSGPNHPALGEMVESRLYLNKIFDLLNKTELFEDTILTISVAKGSLSKAIGQKKINKERIMQNYPCYGVKFKEDSGLSGYEVKINQERKRKCI